MIRDPRDRQRKALRRIHELADDKSVFVETGTYLGLGAELAREYFDEVHTIELSAALWTRSLAKFEDTPGVHCWHGDSGILLPKVLKRIDGPLVVYLDAHHFTRGLPQRRKREIAEDSPQPIWQELKAINAKRAATNDKMVVVVDDWKQFGTPGLWEDVTEESIRRGTRGVTHHELFGNKYILVTKAFPDPDKAA
jgi:hypothetical protein